MKKKRMPQITILIRPPYTSWLITSIKDMKISRLVVKAFRMITIEIRNLKSTKPEVSLMSEEAALWMMMEVCFWNLKTDMSS